MNRLENKVAIITGAGSGIGQGIALEFFRQKAKLALMDINEEGLDKTILMLGSGGSDCLKVQGDISKKSDIINFIQKTIDAFGRIDILVNNAGIYKLLDLQGTSDEDWMETIAINLTGPFLMIRECLNYLKKNKQSKIINISSSAALNAFPNSTAYTASKGGLLAMSRQLAMELAPHQIYVNVICPGVIQTPMLGDLMSDPETKEALENCQPVGRLGTPEDIAMCCVYLAADESNLVTGACIAVDGGWSTTIRGC